MARAADDEEAPRRWVDYRDHHVVNGNRYRPAGYGWRYRARDYRDGAAVYRWSGCGVYHYRNGEQCVDARVVAPPQ